MKNPFPLTYIKPGQPFCDREEESAKIRRIALEGTHQVLYARRRLGKTSLVLHVLDNLAREGVVTVCMDLTAVTTPEQFSHRLLEAIGAAVGFNVTDMSVMNRFFSFFKNIKWSMGLDDAGRLQISPSYVPREVDVTITDVLHGFDAWLEKQGKRGVIFFDEVQEIAEIKGGIGKQIEDALRMNIQAANQYCCIFAGSRRTAMKKMFQDQDRMLYQLTRNTHLQAIPRNKFVPYIEMHFYNSGKECLTSHAGQVYDFCRGHTHYVQKLANILWGNTATSVDDNILRESMKMLLLEEADFFSSQYSILSQSAKLLACALSRETTNKPFAIDYLTRHGLNVGGVQRALKELTDQRDYIEQDHDGNYAFTDPVFARWCRTL